jgi:hypothetical protein
LSTSKTPDFSANSKGAIHAHAGALYGNGNVGGGLVLGYVTRFDTRHRNFGNARGLQRGNFGFSNQRAFLEHEVALADRMDRGRAERITDRNGTELHASSAFCRKTCVISPMIATAISAGDTASISSPIGA